MNNLILNWKKISKGIPAGRKAANDRAQTLEEIQKLTDYPDRRIKSIVYVMVSSGIRIGAHIDFDMELYLHENHKDQLLKLPIRGSLDKREEYVISLTKKKMIENSTEDVNDDEEPG
jgi:hypothetical protein